MKKKSKHQLFFRYQRIGNPEINKWIMTKRISLKHKHGIMKWTNTSHNITFPHVFPAHENMKLVKRLRKQYSNGISHYVGLK